jgi:hypothetical protein
MDQAALLDARKPSRDPTGTGALRRTFRAVAEIRLRQLQAMLRTAVIEHDVLGLSGGPTQYAPAFWREAIAYADI